MAQKIQTLFIDDLDGSSAEGTVRFGLDGAEYEIDLNAGTRRSYGMRWPATWMLPPGGRQRPQAIPRQPTRKGGGVNTTEVREWARAQGIEVKDRGRVPADLMVKFRSATSQQG